MLSVTLSNPYPWSPMPDSSTAGCSGAQAAAAAELCYEVEWHPERTLAAAQRAPAHPTWRRP
jgi:hypothetical protein